MPGGPGIGLGGNPCMHRQSRTPVPCGIVLHVAVPGTACPTPLALVWVGTSAYIKDYMHLCCAAPWLRLCQCVVYWLLLPGSKD